MSKLESLGDAVRLARREEQVLKQSGILKANKKWALRRAIEDIKNEVDRDNWRPCPYGIEPSTLAKIRPEPVEVKTSYGQGVDSAYLRLSLFVDGRLKIVERVDSQPLYDLPNRYYKAHKHLMRLGRRIKGDAKRNKAIVLLTLIALLMMVAMLLVLNTHTTLI